jgi:hypothetical protein
MLRRLVAAFTLALTAGCSSLRPVPVEFITDANPPEVHIYNGYRMMVIDSPRLSGDTVHGSERGKEVAIPLRQVQQVSAVRFSSLRTTALIGGIMALGGLAAFTILTRANGDGSEYCDYDIPPMVPGSVICGYPGNP